MVETDPNVALKVETMDQVEFSSYLAVRQSAVAGLPMSIEDYSSKRLLLEKVVGAEKNAAEVLRAVSQLTVQDGAANQNLTVERRNALLIRLRQDLFAARQMFLYTESKS